MVFMTRLKADKPSAGPLTQGLAPADIPWQRDERGYYHRLLRLRPRDAGLFGTGGVYVIWHRGVRPRWIYIGASKDLGEAIDRARDSEAVLGYEAFGGVYVTWAPVRQEFRDGVVAYLRASLEPELDLVFASVSLDLTAAHIPVQPPA